MTERLKDPNNLLGPNANEIEKKLIKEFAKLARGVDPEKKEQSGNPFFYSIVSNKEHIVVDTLPKVGKVKNLLADGARYYWSADFLKKATGTEIRYWLVRKSIHVFHRHHKRGEGKNKDFWDLATIFYANALYETEVQQISDLDIKYAGNNHPLWQEPMGPPTSFDDFLKDLEKQKRLKQKIKIDKNKFYADRKLLGLSAQDIYEKIKKAVEDPSGGQGGKDKKESGGPNAQGEEETDQNGYGEGFQEHMPLQISDQEIINQIEAAQSLVSMMRGEIPNSIKSQLAELVEPELSWEDFAVQSCQRTTEKAGAQNTWSRFSKRAMALGLLMPKKVYKFANILVLLDTSGSMSDKNIAHGLSQLLAIEGYGSCWIVPTDAIPHWEDAVEIKSLEDFPKINIIGRGGTVFDDFFKDFEEKMGDKGPFDLIIVITDGDFKSIPPSLNPGVDTIFIVTSGEKISPPFGVSAPLIKRS